MKLFPSLPDNQHYTPLCKYRGSGTRHPGNTGHWSCGQQNINNHHSHRLMMGLPRRNHYCQFPSEYLLINEATQYFLFGILIIPVFWVFPSVFAVIYNRGEQENKKYCFCSLSQSRGAMIAVCISPGLYLSPIILMDDHCKRDWR